MSVTMRDVAKACNVSIFTVSSVLHNKRNIKEETRQKVQETIKEMQYNPLRNIPLLKKAKTNTMGLILPISKNDISPFYYRAILSAQQTLVEKGITVTIFPEHDVEKAVNAGFDAENPRFRCDGIICFCPNGDWNTYLDTLSIWGIPTILVQRTTTVPNITCIRSSDYEGAKTLMEYLIKLGHKRIALVYIEHEVMIAVERKNAFHDVIEEHQLSAPDCPTLTFTLNESHGMRNTALQLKEMASGPTAVFCYDDGLAVSLISELAQLGVRVPDDISVVGYGDDPLATMLAPKLTTVRMPVEEMVAQACNLLLDQKPGNYTQPSDICFPPQLMIRESVGTL